MLLFGRRVRPPAAVACFEKGRVVTGWKELVVVAKQFASRNSVESKCLEVDEPAPANDDHAGRQVRVQEQRQRRQAVPLHVPRGHLHDVALGSLEGQRGGGRQLREQVDAQDQDGAHGIGDPHEGPQQLRKHLGRAAVGWTHKPAAQHSAAHSESESESESVGARQDRVT